MKRKLFYGLTPLFMFTLLTGLACGGGITRSKPDRSFDKQPAAQPSDTTGTITLFLAGDVMTGRGIDQVLPHPGDPLIYEPVMRSARGYVELAEQVNGPIQQPVDFAYIWGDALEELERGGAEVRIINLETSVTTSNDYWPGKGIQYRMHPQNIPVLTAAKIDYCSLANNHVLDWGYAGLSETLETLRQAKIYSGGAGRNLQQATAPAVIEVAGKGRVIVFSFGLPSSGIPVSWAASADRPGVNLLTDLSAQTVWHIRDKVKAVKQAGDIVVASIHWGGNWGYDIPLEQTEFAHRLIDEAGVDVIHGHSSHHIKGIEVYQDKPIIYGAGDFLNDYEGIGGYEEFRADLTLMYLVRVDPATGKLVHLQMTPMQIKQFRANRVSRADGLWLRDLLDREGRQFGTHVEMSPDNTLTLRWE